MTANVRCVVILCLLISIGSFGCREKPEKSEIVLGISSRVHAGEGPIAVEPPAVRVHWLGTRRICADTNATSLISIGSLPESIRLKDQAIDKLSRAPWRVTKGESGTNSGSGLLRPLIEDLIEEQWFFESVKSSSGGIISALAIHSKKADLWVTNLALVCESESRQSVVWNQGMKWRLCYDSQAIEMHQSDGWIIVAWGDSNESFLDSLRRRLMEHRRQVGSSVLNVEISFAALVDNWPQLKKISEHCNTLSFDMTVGGEFVHTRATLSLINLELPTLEPWIIPTNLIDGSFLSFSGWRGLKPFGALGHWNEKEMGPIPDQIYCWSLGGPPMQTYVAAPVEDSNEQVKRISNQVLAAQHLLFLSSDLGQFGYAGDQEPGLIWRGLPFMSPFLKASNTNVQGFLFAGFAPHFPIQQRMPPDLLKLLTQRTNTMNFDWELTGLRIEQWIFIGQFIRLVTGKPQLSEDAVGLKWLQALVRRLIQPSTTEVVIVDNQIHLARKSAIGFNAIELHIIADWLESPTFPRSFHTLSFSDADD